MFADVGVIYLVFRDGIRKYNSVLSFTSMCGVVFGTDNVTDNDTARFFETGKRCRRRYWLDAIHHRQEWYGRLWQSWYWGISAQSRLQWRLEWVSRTLWGPQTFMSRWRSLDQTSYGYPSMISNEIPQWSAKLLAESLFCSREGLYELDWAGWYDSLLSLVTWK